MSDPILRVIKEEKPMMRAYKIYNSSGCYFGTYYGETQEAAFHSMETDGGGSAGDIGGWIIELVSCPSPSLHFSPSDDFLNTKILTLADCAYCGEEVVVR
jgi:hypothetical protein